MGYLSRFTCAALLTLAVLSTASAGVNTPQSGWYSGNPLLGPNTLRDLACSGSTCYAAGDFGTLLKSKDAGATWDVIVTGLTLDLTRVRLAGGSPDQVVVGGGCAVRRSDDGGDTFFRMPFTARDVGCEAGVVSFSFPSDKIGYLLLAGGRILATADGGHSFSRRTPVLSGASDLLCTADRTCLAAMPGVIMRTEDGAVSWTIVGTGSVTALEQADPLTLYAVGQSSTMRKSVDGGRTWTSRTVGGVPVRLLSGIRCGDSLHCLITTQDVGGAAGPLYRTTDGAGTFTSVVPSPDPTLSVAFASPVRAVVAGGSGSAEVSNDAGGTWSAVGSRIAGSFTTLAAISDTVAYAGGLNGVLARTTDSGATWSNVSPPTEQSIDRLTGWKAARPLPRLRNAAYRLRPRQPREALADEERRRALGPAAVARHLLGLAAFVRRCQQRLRRRSELRGPAAGGPRSPDGRRRPELAPADRQS